MRSWRRGMREMDLLLGPFAEAELPAMPPRERDAYAALLEENDQDLYAWVIAASGGGTGSPAPAEYAPLIDRIAAAAAARLAKS
ncbi:succinate dehydrogenase assembly factor 2 [Paracoccus suum]|uniref:FAD assembly factor SdhE n=2 Tax=Paracoccus suum TaxID=2259340 RepID=A0A344PP06_9RHOB|nr:succinate dehydrogenase assembly factor 2 [Paracoccus suum]